MVQQHSLINDSSLETTYTSHINSPLLYLASSHVCSNSVRSSSDFISPRDHNKLGVDAVETDPLGLPTSSVSPSAHGSSSYSFPLHPSNRVSGTGHISDPLVPTSGLSLPTLSLVSVVPCFPDQPPLKLTQPKMSHICDWDSKLVVNLSNASLSLPTFNFLKKGLGFVVSPRVIPHVEFLLEIENIFRPL
ncbi:hypothetical protein SUGI_0033650 [Cryptomeria japonica]|nr:hypothetical protein SUGI_0033650 [Cryptomeria japonica]